MTTSDPVGTAVASIGAGATSGAAVMTAGVFVLRIAQAGDPAAVAASAGATVIGVSLFLGIVAAVASAWWRTRVIDDRWRRGVAAAVSVFGAALLALIATPADLVAGRLGLGLYLTVLLAAAVLTHLAAMRAAAR